MSIKELESAGAPSPGARAGRQIVHLHGELLQLRHATVELGDQGAHPRRVQLPDLRHVRLHWATGEHVQQDPEPLVPVVGAVRVGQERQQRPDQARVVHLEWGYVRFHEYLSEFEQRLGALGRGEFVYGQFEADYDAGGGVGVVLVARVRFDEFRGLQVSSDFAWLIEVDSSCKEVKTMSKACQIGSLVYLWYKNCLSSYFALNVWNIVLEQKNCQISTKNKVEKLFA